MARKRTSAVEDFIVVLSHLPWWMSLLIALVSWLILHPVATAPAPPAALKPGDMGGILTAQLWRTLAQFGHYLIPFCCVLGAIGSIAARRKRKHLFDSVKTATQPARTIDGLSWQQFEQLIGEAFRKQGYSITETGGNGPDGGVDLILRKHNEKYLVQCKHWRLFESRRAGGTRILRRHGRRGRGGWLRRHLRPVHSRGQGLRRGAQYPADRRHRPKTPHGPSQPDHPSSRTRTTPSSTTAAGTSRAAFQPRWNADRHAIQVY